MAHERREVDRVDFPIHDRAGDVDERWRRALVAAGADPATLATMTVGEAAALVQAFGRRVVPLFESGKATALVHRVFPLAEAADALDYVRAPGKLGKVLLEMPA